MMTTIARGTAHRARRSRGGDRIENGAEHAPRAASQTKPRTNLPRRDLLSRRRRRTGGRGISRDEVFTVGGSAIAALAIGTLFTVVIGLMPVGWLLIVSFVWFVALYTTLVFLSESGPAVTDRFWSVMLWAAAVVVVGSLALVVGFTLLRGQDVFVQIFADNSDQTSGRDFTSSLTTWVASGRSPTRPGRHPARHRRHPRSRSASRSRSRCLSASPPRCSSDEVGGRFARFVRTVVEAMTALPSVVAGLFIYAAVIVRYHQGSSTASRPRWRSRC